MPFITKINTPGVTTLTKFHGDVINRIADWTNNIDVAAADASKKPIINTETLFQPNKLKIYDGDSTHTFRISTSNLSADKTINLPSFTAASDDILLAAAVQTITGKTIDANSNTVSNVVISAKANLPANVVFNDQNNTIGAYYIELQETTAPAAPASGRRRLYIDSTTHKATVRTSASTSVSLEEGQTGTWDPNAIETFTNKTISGSSNTLSNIADGSLSANVSKNNANQTVTGIKTYENYIDVKAVSEPAQPSATYVRLYVRATDANNDEIIAYVKKAGTYVKVVIA